MERGATLDDMVVVVEDERGKLAGVGYPWPLETRLFLITGGLGFSPYIKGMVKGQWLCLGPTSAERCILNQDIARLANLYEIRLAKQKYGWD